MDQPVSRRAWLAALVSGAGVVAAACKSDATEVDTPEGKVLQWEGDDMLVLVSGVQPSYRTGETIKLNVLVNNQTTRLAEVKIRTKLLGKGDQPVVQADAVTLTVKSDDAANVDQQLLLGKSLPAGDYVVSVELPPWRLDGRESGQGASLRAPVQIEVGS